MNETEFLLQFYFTGVYTCEAFNDCGESFSSGTLVVSVPGEDARSPFFKEFPASATVATGEGASFTAATDVVTKTNIVMCNYIWIYTMY